MAVKVQFDTGAIAARLNKRIRKAQQALDVQVLKDSNYYCPVDSGTLQRSAVISSGGGEIVWNQEYANYQYYTDNKKSKDVNPNASMKWFEKAKVQMRKAWVELVNRVYKNG